MQRIAGTHSPIVAVFVAAVAALSILGCSGGGSGFVFRRDLAVAPDGGTPEDLTHNEEADLTVVEPRPDLLRPRDLAQPRPDLTVANKAPVGGTCSTASGSGGVNPKCQTSIGSIHRRV